MGYLCHSSLERSLVATVHSGQITEVDGPQMLCLGPARQVSLQGLVAPVHISHRGGRKAEYRNDQPWPRCATYGC
jgi:hypothetical protein